ncbi:MAG: carbohydrate binding domain-containing protein [Prevotella sp.]|nr:carbohydrate binding domain-containing protein [Prevotella sp.]
MKKANIWVIATLAVLVSLNASAQHQFTVNAKKLGAPIQSTMYGIFFEDINFGADGGLYAEMVENRSFEFPQQLMGWNTFGKVQVNDANPAFDRNPHYVTLKESGHRDKFTGLENRGFFGMGLKKGMDYHFSVYARTAGSSQIRVELVGSDDEVMTKQQITIAGNNWKKYTVTLKSPKTDAKGLMRIYLEGKGSVDLDHVSLFPADAWKGLLRADLVKDLKDLNPGVFRFPGGCIVEGTDLNSRYQWKNSVGPAENRPLNENRWNYTFPHRLFPNYYQSYGLGFYEFFLLSEEIGAQALPVLSCGLACQFQNDDKDEALCHVAVDDLQPYIDDALDLIEFANGGTDTKWGKLRADMGHPAPFNLQQIGVGNEQWGPLYPVRLEKFMKAIRAKYPKMKIVGTSGPSPDDNDGKQFSYGWEQMKKLKADLVDEHYYRDQDWFMNNVTRYDNYDRKGPKVFAGEYACHVKEDPADFPTAKNVFEAALAEAAIMTGFERNADIVHMATYAPLFAHVEGWQWRPDLIWMDNLTTVRTPNYYVQQMYGQNPGTHVLSLLEGKNPVTGQDGLCASAVYDKNTNGYIVKITNTSTAPKEVVITFKGIKSLGSGKVTTLHADRMDAANTIEKKNNVVPQTADVQADGNVLRATIPAKTFALYRF